MTMVGSRSGGGGVGGRVVTPVKKGLRLTKRPGVEQVGELRDAGGN